MRFGSLFTGIGGLDLGLERAGLRCEWQVEIDPFCRRVLEKHWPGVRRHDDVRTFPPTKAEGWAVDCIAGGFPCQDVSKIGVGAGLDAERSGLWSDYARIIGQLRPRYVVVENVPALLGRGIGRVLGDLAAIGYDSEWQAFPAAALGALHVRDRVWIVAYPGGERLEEGVQAGPASRAVERDDRAGAGLAPVRVLRGLPLHDPRDARPRLRVSPGRGMVVQSLRPPAPGLPDESPPCRVAGRIPDRVDRIRSVGNAVSPAVAQWVGERLMSLERGRRP